MVCKRHLPAAGARRPLRAPGPSRRGVTLIEVLVSMFVMAVGILGVAALLPMAGLEVRRAKIAHSASIVGQDAYRSVRVRGYLRPATWLRPGGAAVLDAQGQLTIRSGNNNGLPAFAIDPMGIAGSSSLTMFPYQGAGSKMHRLSVRQDPVPVDDPSQQGRILSPYQAAAICKSHDDLTFKRPDDASLPTEQLFAEADDPNGDPNARSYEGRYSWMFTLAPHFDAGEQSTAAARYVPRLYTMSVVVYLNRIVTDPAYEEPVAQVGAATPPGVGGGEVMLTVTNVAHFKGIFPGRWIMLYNERGTQFKWYRILAMDQDEGSNTTERFVSLAGPDWDRDHPGAIAGGQVYAVLPKGVVGVYEKVVDLEGHTLWQRQ